LCDCCKHPHPYPLPKGEGTIKYRASNDNVGNEFMASMFYESLTDGRLV
jgi:hypothetical protein